MLTYLHDLAVRPGGEKLNLQYEIRRDDHDGGYMLVLTASDGQKRVEHVDEPTVLIERSVDQLRQLRDDGWKVG